MDDKNISCKAQNEPPQLYDFGRWLASMGKTPITGWRWRQRGIVKTLNIFGRVYISQEEAENFVRRAQAGEFAQPHKTPRIKKETSH